MNQQVVVKSAEGQQLGQTIRLDLNGFEIDLDLRHEPNHRLAVELGYVFPASEAGRGQ